MEQVVLMSVSQITLRQKGTPKIKNRPMKNSKWGRLILTKLAQQYNLVNNADEEFKEGKSGALCNKVGNKPIKWG